MSLNRDITAAVFALAVLSPIAASAAPASGYYDYRGAMVVVSIPTASATACKNAGYSVGDEFNMRFTPPGATLGSNGDTWKLSIFQREYAQNFQYSVGNYPGAVAKPTDLNMTIGRGYRTFKVTPQVAITTQTPGTITTSTLTVTLIGKIQNFGDTASTTLSEGCEINFRASGILKP